MSVEAGAAPPDSDGLVGLVRGVDERFGPGLAKGVIDSMTGARGMHDDTFEQAGHGAGAVGGQDRPARCLSAGRWALMKAATNAVKHPVYTRRYQHTTQCIGRGRGPEIGQSAPAGGALPSGRLKAPNELRYALIPTPPS